MSAAHQRALADEAQTLLSHAWLAIIGDPVPAGRMTAAQQDRLEREIGAALLTNRPVAMAARARFNRARELWWELVMTERNVARRVAYKGAQRSRGAIMADDLEQDAMSGLFEAARRWDPDIASFRTHGTWWARSAINKAFGGYMVVTVPTDAVETAYTASRLAERLGIADEARLAEAVGVGVSYLRAARSGVADVVPVVTSAGGHDSNATDATNDSARMDVTSGFEPAVGWDPVRNVQAARMCDAIDGLPPRLRDIVGMRLSGMSNGEVGRRIGVSEQRASQLEHRAHELVSEAVSA